MKKIFTFILLLLSFGWGTGIAQKRGQALVDSLIQELPKQKEDTNKVIMLNNISTLYYNINTDEGTKYANQTIDLATTTGWKVGIAMGYNVLGMNYLNSGNVKAMDCFQKAIKIGEETGDKKTLGNVFNNVGTYLFYKGDYQNSITYFLKTIAIDEETGNKAHLSLATGNVANIYIMTGNYTKALEYFSKSIKTDEETGNKRHMGMVIGNVGNIYFPQGNYPKALEFFFKALKINEDVGNKKDMSGNLCNIGAVYQTQGEYTLALEYLFKSLKIAEEVGDVTQKAKNLGNIGAAYFALKNYTKALEFYFQKLEIDEKKGNKPGMGIVTGNIGEVYASEANYSKALEYYFRSLKIEEGIGREIYIANIENSIGTIYVNLAEDTSVKITIANDSITSKYVPGGLSTIPASRSLRLEQAYSYLNKALALAKKVNSNDVIKDCYLSLSRADKLKGDYSQAMSDYQNYVLVKDSLFSKENDKKIMQQQMKYDYDKKEDSVKLESEKKELALQKEIELKAVKYEYEKKQAAAKSEKERQQLKYEQQIKEQQIEYDYEQKTAKAEAEQRQKDVERKQREAIARIEQEKKDALTQEQLKREKNIRYASIGGAGLLLIIAIVSTSAYRQKQRDNKTILIEKQRSEELLLNILPSEVAEELKNKGSSDAKHFDQATVLFTDFKGFTNMSEKMTADELVAELNHCFKGFDEIVHKYGIEKIKTIGDSYMAAGGLPDPGSCTPEGVVKAALEMNDFILKRKAERDKAGKLSFEMRVGIHTGPVVAGIVGIKKFQYDIWGDTVNTASRMESSGEVGRVNISGTTYELVKDQFKCEYRGKVSAKGKGEVDMYFVS